MAARAVGTARAPRTIQAAALLAVLLVALLGAWFASGWHDVRLRQQELRQAPHGAAGQRAAELARDVRNELDALLVREGRRPYFHYQNLMHDPRASEAVAVSPSPLAAGSTEAFVRGYFQLDASGRATTPTINTDVPELSEPTRLADHRRFLARVVQDISPALPRAAETGPRAAGTTPAPRPSQPPQPTGSVPRPVMDPWQIISMDPGVYAQNVSPNRVYGQQVGLASRGQTSSLPPPEVPVTPAPVIEPPEPVTITISPLELRTLPFDGTPTIVATRQVQTPDGTLTQGFVIDRPALTTWLGKLASGMVADLQPGDGPGVVAAPGWSLQVEPGADAIALASAGADAVARTFVMQFVGIGSVAALAAGLVLLFVARAERLARERSQFAAAAAHELRTPLAGLQLYGDMLADGLGDPGKRLDYARSISDDAARLGRVVSNMLGFTQLERGGLSVDASDRPLSQALIDIAERARPALVRVGALLELDVAPGLRATFDPDALSQIVGNLLDNAEKYTRDSGDRTIRLAAAGRGQQVEVMVEDRGPGVLDGTHLFHAFSRGTRDDAGPAGLGLGLALSRSLARAMGGELRYTPRDGGGATFILQLRSPTGS